MFCAPLQLCWRCVQLVLIQKLGGHMLTDHTRASLVYVTNGTFLVDHSPKSPFHIPIDRAPGHKLGSNSVFLSRVWLHVINQDLVSYHGSPFNTVGDNSILLSKALGTPFSHWPSFHFFILDIMGSAVDVVCAVCWAVSGQ